MIGTSEPDCRARFVDGFPQTTVGHSHAQLTLLRHHQGNSNMISDVLCECVDSIQQWQRQLPRAYCKCTRAIKSVTNVMEGFRVYLDYPPFTEPDKQEAAQKLLAAIENIDTQPVIHAMKELYILLGGSEADFFKRREDREPHP